MKYMIYFPKVHPTAAAASAHPSSSTEDLLRLLRKEQEVLLIYFYSCFKYPAQLLQRLEVLQEKVENGSKLGTLIKIILEQTRRDSLDSVVWNPLSSLQLVWIPVQE